ncbi:P2Y purinoceptor 13-like [Antennarius striatus]|uniref:P2Y purinoceptor 13-like n=1 Tax=Antennarius striatus TaxID=241820 RepID=UPI0035B2A94B
MLNQISPNSSECVSFIFNSNTIPVLYFLMSPIALLLNGVAAWVSLRIESTSTFVVYLKNLIAADVIITLIMPITAAGELQQASKFLFVLSCYVKPIFYSTQYACICLLGLISQDRFFRIMAPQSNLFLNKVIFSKLASVAVWVLLYGSTALPNIILSNRSAGSMTQISSCVGLKGPAGIKYHKATVIYLNVLFWGVTVVITVSYVCITNKVIQSFRNSGSNNNQGKQRIRLRVFLVVIVFFVSFGPYHIFRIPYTSLQVSQSAKSACLHLGARFIKEFCLWFASTNICMNPLLYIFLCREFKEKFSSMVENVSLSIQGTSEGKAIN